MPFSSKAPQIQSIMRASVPFPQRLDAGDGCPICDMSVNVAKDFRDDISRKEFEISRLCQRCQDNVFGIEIPNAETCDAGHLTK